ncbi:hypothetical protein [Zoogloea sp. LCSB751]|uniref:hypothetical protein n=1 Tax=Zoogloea sp. LCSB751 TaxID=1965277 RepID=UPI001374729B|nr:hypothetical protein [Zoogloea sp. LCSB751]
MKANAPKPSSISAPVENALKLHFCAKALRVLAAIASQAAIRHNTKNPAKRKKSTFF